MITIILWIYLLPAVMICFWLSFGRSRFFSAIEVKWERKLDKGEALALLIFAGMIWPMVMPIVLKQYFGMSNLRNLPNPNKK